MILIKELSIRFLLRPHRDRSRQRAVEGIVPQIRAEERDEIDF